MSQLVFPGEVRQRQPSIIDRKHLAFIKTLFCAVCGTWHYIDPAHLRAANLHYGKPFTGRRKPDDRWVNPLCREHHDEQHRMKELAFWDRHGIDPFELSQALYAVTGDREEALTILSKFSSREATP